MVAITTSWRELRRLVVLASSGYGPWLRSWRGQGRGRASGRPRTRRFSDLHVPRCGVSSPRLRAGMTLLRLPIPWSSGVARTAAVLMLRSRALMSASGFRLPGWMRPGTSRCAHVPPLIMRLSGRWLDCSAGSRSQRRGPGSGSRTCVPCKCKRGTLWTRSRLMLTSWRRRTMPPTDWARTEAPRGGRARLHHRRAGEIAC